MSGYLFTTVIIITSHMEYIGNKCYGENLQPKMLILTNKKEFKK